MSPGRMMTYRPGVAGEAGVPGVAIAGPAPVSPRTAPEADMQPTAAAAARMTIQPSLLSILHLS